MRAVLFTALACSFATAAFVDPGPLDGHWAMAREACTNTENNGDIVPTVIEGNAITYFESACTITDMTPIGTQESAWRVKTDCSGEGETWSQELIYAIDRDPNGKPLQLVEVDMQEGYVIVSQYCD